MSVRPENSPPSAVDLEAAADQAIAACGDAREAVKALLVAVDFLDGRVAELRDSVSSGYARGRLTRDRGRDRNG
jgi:hypothetical protein